MTHAPATKQVEEIRNLHGTMPQIQIARMYGISYGHLLRVQAGDSWKNL